MQKSVRRVITQDDDTLYLSNGEERCASNAQEFFGGLPERKKYTVTYTLDPLGEFLVAGHGIERDRNLFRLTVCFLPYSWHGHRVSRKVSIGRA